MTEIVIVNQRPIITVVDDAATVAVINAPGPQGIPGPTGPPGGAFVEYTVSSPSATWVITHNSGHRVHVSILDEDGHVMYPDVDHDVGFNSVTVTFSSPTTGSAVIS